MASGCTPFSVTEAREIQVALAAPLSRESVSTRPAPGGGKVIYVEAHRTFNFANNIFGALWLPAIHTAKYVLPNV